jgi:hypothetical protein
MIARSVFAFVFILNISYAQDISGLWVHDEDGTNPTGIDEVYAIMYLDVDNLGKVVGFTYDFHANSSCSFYLEGDFDSEKERLKVVNTKKIEKSFLHARARFKLFYEKTQKNEFLIGSARQKGIHGFVFSFGGLFNIPLSFKKIKPENHENIKGYDVLKPYIESLDLDSKELAIDNVSLNKPLAVKLEQKETTDNSENSTQEYGKEEQLLPELVEINVESEEIEAFKKSIGNREDEALTTLKVKSRIMTIEIFDNSRQDEDRISIFVNDRLIAYNLEIKKEPKVISFNLPEDKKNHKILFVANNMGKVPPNTAKIKYTLDGISREEELFTNFRLNKYLEIVIID